jgi:hypothetical protein|uniref:Uncharacterized protein n=1 Tax=Podoviridae sp. ctZ5d16 TaxID=2825257 RepID=A0A8S5Q9U0_9CAUD|nr:MAG TPA: hypothetical protein [Podoviridae sp. ctZ5d16]
MRTEQKYNLTWLYPDENKVIVKVGDETGERYSSLVLAKDDSPENYTEIDILTPEIPVEPEVPPIEIIPDPEGKITYEDAKKLLDTIAVMQDRVVTLQESNDMLTECILEMSQVVYSEEGTI